MPKAKLKPIRERLGEKYRIEGLVFQDEKKALEAVLKHAPKSGNVRDGVNQIVPCIIDPLTDFLFYEEENPDHYAGRRIHVTQAGDTAKFAFRLE